MRIDLRDALGVEFRDVFFGDDLEDILKIFIRRKCERSFVFRVNVLNLVYEKKRKKKRLHY